MKTPLAPLILILPALLTVSCLGQVRRTRKGYLFRVLFVKGRAYRYGVTSTVRVANAKQATVVTGPLILATDGVSGQNGIISSVFGPLASGSSEVMRKQSQRYKENSLGEIVDTRLPQSQVIFPAGVKKPGQTWSAHTSVQAVGSNSIVTATYRFLGMTNYKGKRVAKLVVKLTSKGESDTNGTGTIYILADDGSILESKFAISMTMPSQGIIHTTMDMSRQ